MKKVYIIALLLLLYCSLHAQYCDTGESTVIASITTDLFGSETSWKIHDNNTNFAYALISNGTYPDDTIATYIDTICIPKNTCVTFSINDSTNDGLCCDYGEGSYQVTSDGVLVAEGGVFTWQEKTIFNCPPGGVCHSAIAVSEGSHTTQTADYWYTFTPPQSGIYNISTCDLNTCNTKIWIYNSCDANITENNAGTIFYNDDNSECNTAARLEIPLNSTLTYYIRIGDSNDNCAGSNINWTLFYIGPVTGCTDPQACNYNPIATVSDSLCYYAGDINCPGPDLVVLQDELYNSIYTQGYYNDDVCTISEGCLQGYGSRDLIRFTTAIKNIGDIDYFVGAEDTDTTGQFNYNNCHGHLHYDGYAEYLLFDENSTEIPIGIKTGFCVADIECDDGILTKYSCDNMGITAGCTDIYDAYLDCQWIDITDIVDGKYTFVMRVNWDNSPDALGRYETDTLNNWAQVCIDLYTSASGSRKIEKLDDCETFVDCLGQLYGSAQPDCEGICNGSALRGDLDANGIQEIQDAHDYITRILGDDISPTNCNDLNADDNISVYDAALLASCLNFGAGHSHSDGPHDHCDFPDGIFNPYDTVTLSINSINQDEQYIDIDITNPYNGVVAYQFAMSGIEIMSVENLVDPAQFPISPQTVPGGNTIIGISYEDSLITKNPITTPLCRIRYMNITDSEICIASITEIVNHNYEQTVTKTDSTCIIITDIDKPFDYIEVSVAPNPMDSSTAITFPNPGNEVFTLKITDVTGKVVQTHKELRGTTHIIQRGSLQSGVYLFYLESDGKTGIGKLVVK